MQLSWRRIALVVVMPVGFAAAWIAGLPAERSGLQPQALAPAAAVTNLVSINGSQPLSPPRRVTLDLAGEVTGLASGDGGPAVTVSVGQRTFEAQVRNGGYQVRITDAWPNEMVRIEARGTRVHYVSIVGSVGRLRALSGGDGNVTLMEYPALRVSPWSTALSWMVRLTLGGGDAKSDTEFEKATRSVVGEDVVVAAYAMEAIARGSMVLPQGHADGYAFIQDETAYGSMLENGSMREQAQSYLFEQAASAPIRSLSQLPKQLLLLGAVPYGEIPLHVDDLLLLERKADGNYSLYEDEPLTAPDYSATLGGGGDVQLSPLNDHVKYYAEPWGGFAERTSRGRFLRRIQIGALYSIWAVKSDWRDLHLHDPDHNAPYEQLVTDYRVFSGFDLANIPHDGWPSLTAVGRAMPWICLADSLGTGDPRLSECDYVVHEFEANGVGSTIEHGSKVTLAMQPASSSGTASFNWKRDPQGTVLISANDVATRFWPLTNSLLGPVFYLSAAQDGGGTMQSIAGLSATLPDFREAISAPGTWRSGLERSTPTRYPVAIFGVDVVRETNGYGQDIDYGTSSGTYPIQWKNTDAGVFDTRSFAAFNGMPGRYVRSCSEAFASGASACAPIRVRVFRELVSASSADGALTSYGIEEFYQQSALSPSGTVPQYSVTRFSRPNFFYCQAGACLPAAAARATTWPAFSVADPRPVPAMRPAWVDFFRPTPILAGLRQSPSKPMPIYAFECTTCGHSFDRLQKLSDPDPETCPECGAHTVKRQLTAPAFRLAGSGWYETDFKKDGDKKRNLVEGGEGAGKPAATPSADTSKPVEKPAAPAAKAEAKPAKPVAGDA